MRRKFHDLNVFGTSNLFSLGLDLRSLSLSLTIFFKGFAE